MASLYGRIFSSATVAETADGVLTIHSAPGRYIMWAVAFLVVLPSSWWCWRRRLGGRFAPGVFFASLTVPLIVVPGIATESVRVTPESLSIRTGFWFAPTDYHIQLTDLAAFIETDEAVAQRGAPRRDTFWEFRYRSGRSLRIDLPDLFSANRAHVIEYLRQHGFQVRNANQALQ